MLVSMTGYGKAEIIHNDISCSLELRSVNSRFVEVIVKQPQFLMSFEASMKKQVKTLVKRGRVDLSLKINKVEKTFGVQVDNEKLDLLYGMLSGVKDRLELSGDVSLQNILSCNGQESIFVNVSEKNNADMDITEDLILDLLSEALKELLSMRQAEGEAMDSDIRKRLVKIVEMVKNIAQRAASVPSEYMEKLKQRLLSLSEDIKDQLNENRLLQELAIYTDRADITEELSRMDSHIAQFYSIMDNNPSGKKLEFLMQEMNREVNTIGSKANNSEIAHHVVSLKCEFEKIREMLQNAE